MERRRQRQRERPDQHHTSRLAVDLDLALELVLVLELVLANKHIAMIEPKRKSVKFELKRYIIHIPEHAVAAGAAAAIVVAEVVVGAADSVDPAAAVPVAGTETEQKLAEKESENSPAIDSVLAAVVPIYETQTRQLPIFPPKAFV